MQDHPGPRPLETAGLPAADSSDAQDSAPTDAPTRKLCDGANEPCRMCQEMANVRVMQSDDLLRGQRELIIVHAGQIYRLLRTRNDKLILQK